MDPSKLGKAYFPLNLVPGGLLRLFFQPPLSSTSKGSDFYLLASSPLSTQHGKALAAIALIGVLNAFSSCSTKLRLSDAPDSFRSFRAPVQLNDTCVLPSPSECVPVVSERAGLPASAASIGNAWRWTRRHAREGGGANVDLVIDIYGIVMVMSTIIFSLRNKAEANAV